MSKNNGLTIRRSVRELQALYDQGDKRPLEDVVRAWHGIKALPPEDERSFFQLGGYHGEPFIYRPAVDALGKSDSFVYWGGYCNHGNVLFPTWHRVYVYKLEQALQSIVPGVAMPYWDETSPESLTGGIPTVLTQDTFTFSDAPANGDLAGKCIPNPLKSFTLPVELTDDMDFPSEGDTDHMYAKPAGYTTVRYPLSGLVGTADARAKTAAHNAQYEGQDIVALLNENVLQWLNGIPPQQPAPTTPVEKYSIYQRYKACLNAPNYTAFSNTTSAAKWNKSNSGGVVIPLEDPHNDVHLATGGYDAVVGGDHQEFGILAEANGDMGENNTAAMDPIFFFHHCNVDRMFWLWQVRNGKTESFDIISGYAGTSSSDSQGPTPGFPPGASLGLTTPLNPFKKTTDDGLQIPYTSEDCFDIRTQFGYDYSDGSFSTAEEQELEALPDGMSDKTLAVTSIDRALFQGSFVLKAYAALDGEVTYLGHHSVLSRRNVVKCANCLTHLDVQAYFPLSTLPAEAVENGDVAFHFQIHHRGPQLHPNLKVEFEVID